MKNGLIMSNDELIVLGIDFGKKRIGIAVLEKGFTTPLGIIINSASALEEIRSLCKAKGVDLILVGVSEGITADSTWLFIESLQKVVSIPVETWDETLSTQEATEKYQHALNKYPIDALAACAILEDWQACLPHLEDADPDFIGTG